MYMKSRAQGFGAEVKRRILIGTYVLSHGYYDAYYLQAQRIRRLIANDFVEAFKQCDVIMGPTSPSTAFKLGEKAADPVQMYLSDIYTIAVNLAGLPGMSMPCGFAGGLPVGLQLIGDYFAEAQLLNVAHRYQQATDWHQRRPDGIGVNVDARRPGFSADPARGRLCRNWASRPESGPASGLTATGEQKIESQPLKYLKNRNIKPQPTRPLNARAKCAGKDGIGNLTHLDLMVKEAEVKSFAAQVSIKEHGTCRFDLQDFEQTEKMPQPLLMHSANPAVRCACGSRDRK